MKKIYDILITHADYLAPDMTVRKDQTIAIRDGVIAGFEGLPGEAETVLPIDPACAYAEPPSS